MIFRIGFILLTITLSARAQQLSDLDRFNHVIGTQTIGARYQFTNESRLVETAQVIHDMGSNILKFAMGPDYNRSAQAGWRNVPPDGLAIHSLAELARDEPSHRRVLDMPFAHILIWTNTFANAQWRHGLKPKARDAEYREIYDFASYLLKTYAGTGKTFYLGHWEGDWMLRQGFDRKSPVADESIQGMIDWLNIRQKAVDDAKRDTPHRDVQVWNYTEVNLVQIGIKGERCLTNDVLPKTNVDFVSYSSYDSLNGNVRKNLLAALDHIESKLPPKPGIEGKRVFIGEYGFPAIFNNPQQQAERSRLLMRTGLEWGCPFVLYWELYCNEVENGKPRGFWLIDDKNSKQPVYHTHADFLKRGRTFVEDFKTKNRRLPTVDEYRKQAIDWLR